jgi:hypothetical protein
MKNCAFWELREEKRNIWEGEGRSKKRGKTGMEEKMQIVKNEEESDDNVIIVFLLLTAFE